MEATQIIQVCVDYSELLKKEFPPEKMPEDLGEFSPETKAAWLKHACYMAQRIPEFLEENRREKAMRWLGYLQGILNMSGVITLRDAKEDNMPKGATYNRDA